LARNATLLGVVAEYSPVSGGQFQLGRYRLVRRLGDTGMGEAYLAKLIGIDGFEKLVVIWRVGRTSILSTGLVNAAMLEATRGAALSHAGVAQVLDLGVVGKTCFVVTEYVQGHTLEAVLRIVGELPWPVATRIGIEVAGALSYAHGRRKPNGELLRLVHRRLCPDRIALSSSGDVKVTGFGTSWAWAPLDPYGSPEETRDEPVDGRADVFALGAILHRCVSKVGVPETLREVIDQAMQRYPEQRPTAATLQEELTCILHAAHHSVPPREIATLSETAAFLG
jgi:serine/threonine-protein kinase